MGDWFIFPIAPPPSSWDKNVFQLGFQIRVGSGSGLQKSPDLASGKKKPDQDPTSEKKNPIRIRPHLKNRIRIWQNTWIPKVLANKLLHTEYGVYLKLYGLFDDWNVKDWCGSTKRQEKIKNHFKEKGGEIMVICKWLSQNCQRKFVTSEEQSK